MNQPKDVDIFIAEDSPTLAEQLKYLIEKQGYSVRVPVNGREALRAAPFWTHRLCT